MRRRLIALRSLHPFPSLLVATLTVGMVPLADSAAPLGRYVTLGLGMLFYQFTIGLVNDLVDVSEDRSAKPWKPLVRGAISPRFALVVAVTCLVAALVLTSSVSRAAWLIGVAGFGCGLSYDVYLKRTELSWLPYAIGMPLVPVWVYVASDAWRPLLWWSLPLGALIGFALHLANQAPDVASGDPSGLPGRFGEHRSRVIATLVFGVVVCMVAALLRVSSTPRALAVLVVGGGAIAASPWSTRALGRDGLFGLLAASSACLALLFLSSV